MLPASSLQAHLSGRSTSTETASTLSWSVRVAALRYNHGRVVAGGFFLSKRITKEDMNNILRWMPLIRNDSKEEVLKKPAVAFTRAYGTHCGGMQ
jgi:hypothetical protein